MPPREPGSCNHELNGGIDRRAEVRVLADEETIGTGRRMRAHNTLRKGNAVPTPAGEIPWRTSRRLQEATFRLIQERDGGHNDSHMAIKEDDSRNIIALPARSPKRRHCPLEPTEERRDVAQGPPDVCEDVAEVEQKLPTVEHNCNVRIRRKLKRRRVQFGDPHPLYVHEENKAILGTSSDADDITDQVSTSATAFVREVGPNAGTGIQHIVKQPRSYFDLHCSHIGLRGWRCYRSCIVGQAFCIYHQRPSTSGSGIFVCT